MPAEWAPYDGYRTFYEQDSEYAKGRTVAGVIVTHARGGESPHCYGCANDWTKWTSDGNTPTWLPKTDLSWQVLIQNAEKVGLRSGADFGDIDHVELKINVRWPSILQAYTNAGGGTDEKMMAAGAAIKVAME